MLFFLGILSVSVIGFKGCSYYSTSIAERPYHSDYELWKPTGFYGHGLGFLGTAMIVFGVSMYSSRKRIRALSSWGKISYWLEFHIFLCLVGPIFVLYHTTFKFGGIVSVSFWSMTAVVLSGVIGRYLYVQIPKNIRGTELTFDELENLNRDYSRKLFEEYSLSESLIEEIEKIGAVVREKSHSWNGIFKEFFLKGAQRRAALHHLLEQLKSRNVQKEDVKNIIAVARKKAILLQRVALLEGTQKLFHYWHVVHLPFTIVMFIILAIHIVVAFLFGYRWIF
ncbi:MAG: hypothetical protein AAB071_03010 [Bacteroidota bacterium]